MKKGIYKLNFDCGRQGSLQGVFIAQKDHVKILTENKIGVYWGEVLGKHSEVYGPIDEGEIVLMSDDENAITLIEDLKLETGYNPFNQTSIEFSHGCFEVDPDESIKSIVEKIAAFKKENP